LIGKRKPKITNTNNLIFQREKIKDVTYPQDFPYNLIDGEKI